MNQKEADAMMEAYAGQFDEEIRVVELMRFLEIPHDKYQVHISQLDKLFADEEWCRRLISKLKNKAFW
jgi:hypothetical protein